MIFSIHFCIKIQKPLFPQDSTGVRPRGCQATCQGGCLHTDRPLLWDPRVPGSPSPAHGSEAPCHVSWSPLLKPAILSSIGLDTQPFSNVLNCQQKPVLILYYRHVLFILLLSYEEETLNTQQTKQFDSQMNSITERT